MALFKIEKDTWVAEYEGHKIEVVNDKHMVLLIDGEEVDKQKSLISLSLTLKGKLPDIDKEVIAIINGAENGEWYVISSLVLNLMHSVVSKMKTELLPLSLKKMKNPYNKKA